MSDNSAPSDPAERGVALRSVAYDPAADGPARAAAILLLADDEISDEELTVEPGAPAIVASAVEKAQDIRHARRVIARAIAGEPVPAALFDVPMLPAPAESMGVEVADMPEAERRDLQEILGRRNAPVTRVPAEVPVVRCGRRAWAILVDPELVDPARLRTAPTRPASVATRDVIDQTQWTISLEVITVPREGTIAIAVVDRRGRTRYVGSAVPVDETGIEFFVQSADRPDARPVRVQGRVRAGWLELTRVECNRGAAQRLPLTPLQTRTTPSQRPDRQVSDDV